MWVNLKPAQGFRHESVTEWYARFQMAGRSSALRAPSPCKSSKVAVYWSSLGARPMAQFVPCNLDDGQVVFVKMDQAVTLWPRTDRPGTLIKLVTGDTFAVAMPRSACRCTELPFIQRRTTPCGRSFVTAPARQLSGCCLAQDAARETIKLPRSEVADAANSAALRGSLPMAWRNKASRRGQTRS